MAFQPASAIPSTTMKKTQPPDPADLDPVYRHTRREGCEILIAWAVSMTWTITYCWLYGYDVDAADMPLIAGVPSWVFWGVAVPWLASSVFSLLYALFRMRDDPLDDETLPDNAAGDETES